MCGKAAAFTVLSIAGAGRANKRAGSKWHDKVRKMHGTKTDGKEVIMSGRKKQTWIARTLVALAGFACALVLGGVFYATMVYQLAGEESAAQVTSAQQASIEPLARTADVQSQFPGALLALNGGTLLSEQAEDVEMGGERCRVVTRTYALADDTRVLAVSATPAAYLERLSTENWQAQLITGFVVGEMDAVYALCGNRGMLSARDGACIYMIEAEADEQTLYALGTAAYLEQTP